MGEPRRLLLLLVLVSTVVTPGHFLDPATEEWIEFTRWSTKSVEDLIRRALPTVTSFGATTEIDPKCASSLLKLVFGIRNMKNWAIRMIDASGRPPAGILDGTLSDLGSMDECFAISHRDPTTGKEHFRGRHCALNLNPRLPPKPRQVSVRTTIIDLTNYSEPDSVFVDFAKKTPFFYRIKFRLGICVPSTCGPKDLELIVSEVLKDTMLNSTVPYCQEQEGWIFDNVQILILSIFGIIFCLVFVGSIVHYSILQPENESQERTLLRVLRCFSLKRNYRRMTEDASGRALDVLDGIRVLSMLWIILVHTYAFQHEASLGRIMEIIHFAEFISFGVIVNAWISVDGFFLIGGVLVAYTTLRSIKKKDGQFNVFRYGLRRMWRLFPALYLSTGVLMLMPLVDRGPNYPETIGAETSRCRYLWWMPLFFLNTWGDFNENCMIHSWYVSADLHLYILAALPIYLLYRWPRLGVWTCVFFVFVSAIVTGLVTFLYRLYPTILYLTPDPQGIAEVASMVYLRPYPHLAPYAIGLLVGYRLTMTEGNKRLSKLWMLAGWVTSLSFLMIVLLGAFKWHNGYEVLNHEASLYAAVHRTLWGLGVGWIVYACSTGNDGGVLRPLLGWKLFRRMSPLTYLMYLLHMVGIWQRNASKRERFYLRHYDFIYEFFGNVACAMAAAFVLHLLVEAPFAALDKIIFPDVKVNNNDSPVKEKVPPPYNDSSQSSRM